MNDDLLPFEVGDPTLDEAALRRTVAKGIATRQQLAEERGFDFESLAFGRVFTPVTDNLLLKDLWLYQDQIHVHTTVAPQHVTRFGFLPSILTRLKWSLHGLAVWYSNLLGLRQILFNVALVQFLMDLSQQLRSLESLANQVATLQQQVEELQQQMDKTRSHEH